MPTSRAVVSVLLRALGDFLYTLKAGPAGGLQPPSAGSSTTTAGEPVPARTQRRLR
jgi:hypothetical protein